MTVLEYLNKNGPTLTGKIKEYYLDKEKVSDEAIRKRISRTLLKTEEIKRVGGFFKDNQSLVFTIKHFSNEAIRVNSLYNAIKTDAKAHFYLLYALVYHRGYIKKEHLSAYSHSPIINLKSHKRCDKVIEELIGLKLIGEDDKFYILNPLIEEQSIGNLNRYLATETAKNFILNQFYDLVRSIGLISYDKGAFYKEVFKFNFAFTGPCYVTGILQRKDLNSLPSFLFADILLGNDVNNLAVEFFIKKVDTIKSTSKSGFLPFLIVESLDSETLRLLKSKGIIVGFVDKLFGSKYAEFLKTLIATIENAGAILKTNPEGYLSLIEQLNKLVDGKTNNLRGDLFELAVGYYYSKICNSLNIGRIITLSDTGEKREIDVEANFADKVIFCECKAYKNMVSKDIVEEWLSKKVSRIFKNHHQYNYDNKRCVFEFWSVSGFTEEAISFLKEKKENTKKYDIEFYSEKEIMQKAKDSKAKKISDIMRDYFSDDV